MDPHAAHAHVHAAVCISMPPLKRPFAVWAVLFLDLTTQDRRFFCRLTSSSSSKGQWSIPRACMSSCSCLRAMGLQL
jgi:hypothetical protein